MIQRLRSSFNARYTPENYARLLALLDAETRTHVGFRVAETPCFFPESLVQEMVGIGEELTDQLVGSEEYWRASGEAIPERYRIPNESRQPNSMTVDFGLVRGEDGRLEPKLVELQAFPSVLGYQDVLCRAYREVYGLDPELRCYLGGHTEASFWELLRRVIVGEHEPEHVVLLEVSPETQKTLPDFKVYEDRLGVRAVDLAKVRQEGRRLFYERDGRWVRIERIFNRAIVDEIEAKGIVVPFDYREELEVEWAGNPNWYFRISKFSLPWLKHRAVPRAMFLDDWYDRGGEGLPADRERLILKPLYSFAGQGIAFAPGDAVLGAIPHLQRHQYLLQERVTFEPVIETPEGPTMAEIRIMYLWPDGGAMEPVMTLVRMGRGLMMGVDQNRDKAWVGGSAAFFE